MASILPERPEPFASNEATRFGIVESLYNREFTGPMGDAAVAELRAIDPGILVSRVSAPGSFEIPVLVKALLAKQAFQAVIALGVLLRGETAHADLVASSITHSLQTLAVEFQTPVIHEVLLVGSIEQARERCLGTKLNRGVEAARAAVRAARSIREIAALD